MSKIWLKRFIEKLNRSDGVAIMTIVALMLMMTILGGVFASIMGGWQVSAPYAVNSNRAAQLANSAATFALQEAKNNIENLPTPNPVNCGLRLSLVTVIADDGNGGSADYWIERPGVDDDAITVGVGALNGDDDDVNDDLDDSDPTLYTIIATGRVASGGVAVAQRQIKVFVDFPVGTTLTP